MEGGEDKCVGFFFNIKKPPNNCTDSGHDYLIIMFMYCNHTMQLPVAHVHVCLLSQVWAGDIFWSSFRKKFELGGRQFAYLQNIRPSFCFINRFNEVLFKIFQIL